MIFQVTEKQIEDLNDEQLTELLRKLLIYEAQGHSVPLSSIGLTLNIKAADGGLDAEIKWAAGPKRTQFILSRDVGFQCKATDMGVQQCADEIVNVTRVADPKKKAGAKKKGTKKARKRAMLLEAIKPMVGSLFQRGGDYVIFTSKPLNPSQVNARVAAIRAKLKRLKKPYATKAKIHIFPANQIRSWVNAYLPAIVYVQFVTNQPIVLGLKTWAEWDETFKPTSAYLPDVETQSIKDSVRSGLALSGTVLRVVGLSGLGKTRLALEATRRTTDTDALNAGVVYYDAQNNPTALKGELSEWRRAKLGGVVVVDNCPAELHVNLSREVSVPGSRLSLLTLDLAPNEQLREQTIFKLKPSSTDHIASVVKRLVPAIPESEATKIATLSSGFISFAQLLCGWWQGQRSIEKALPDDLDLPKMLWGGPGASSDAERRAIEACALVESADMGDGSAEARFIADIAGLDTRNLQACLSRFEDRGIVERYGAYVRVRIHPLALRLCMDWWQRCSPERAEQVFASVPESMVSPLCDRLRMLDFLPQAKSLTARLCGARGPFGSAEVLCSARGARIFRALVELNPEACIEALANVIAQYETEELRKLVEPRREWVWALERLIFHSQTYEAAANVLVRLATAESERYANNASGILLQTFHVSLPGTEASLEDRGRFLAGLFADADPAVVQLALKAADSAFTTEFYSRAIGAEDQGLGPALREYTPRTFQEIQNYWNVVADGVSGAVEGKRLSVEDARAVIAAHLRGFARIKQLDFVTALVERGRIWTGDLWEAALGSLGDVAKYDSPGWSSEDKQRLAEWRAKLAPEPSNLGARLRLTVTRPSWSDFMEEPDVEGKQISRAERDAIAIAEECATDFEHWQSCLDALFIGEQRGGYAFGTRLAETLSTPETFVDVALNALKGNAGHANPVVLQAFLRSIKGKRPDLVDRTVEAFLRTTELQPLTPYLLAGLQPPLSVLLLVTQLAKTGAIPGASLRLFAYGRALNHLTPDELARFSQAVCLVDKASTWTALELLYMYCLGEKETWPRVKARVRDLHMGSGLDLAHHGNPHDSHIWKETALKLLEENDVGLAEKLTKDLIRACRSGAKSFEVPDDVARRLLAKYGPRVWPLFGKELLSKGKGTWALMHFLGRGLRGSSEEAGGPLDLLDPKILLGWLGDNPAGAPVIAGMIRPLMPVDDRYEWSQLAKRLIDSYGNNKDVLGSLSVNLHSGMWWGEMRQPHYKKIKALSQRLLKHGKPSVRAWAAQLAKHMDNQIDRDQQEADARKVGRW